jgi:hypothetical protein
MNYRIIYTDIIIHHVLVEIVYLPRVVVIYYIFSETGPVVGTVLIDID